MTISGIAISVISMSVTIAMMVVASVLNMMSAVPVMNMRVTLSVLPVSFVSIMSGVQDCSANEYRGGCLCVLRMSLLRRHRNRDCK